MSRAININATEAHVTGTCTKLRVAISAIEALRSGGTRLVLTNSVDARAVTKVYGNKVLTGPVQRTPSRLQRA